MTHGTLDAVVVGAGPNGLAAAITLARAGRRVHVVEAAPTIGGGTRTQELTLPGFHHDVCSTVLPLTLASPFFRSLDLARHGVRIIEPDAPLAHPLGGDRVALLERSVAGTAARLSTHDARAWRTVFGPLSRDAGQLATELLGPVVHVPRHPLALARFGFPALRSAAGLTRGRFRDDEARALFTGLAAHSMLDLRRPVSAAFGLVLGMFAHALGWPFIEGGTARLAAALAAELLEAGGTIEVDRPIRSFSELPSARVIVLDTSPRDAVAIAGERLDAGTRRALEAYRYGPGVFKVDWALDGPIPWSAPGTARAATVHLGGTWDRIVAGEADVAAGRHPDEPFTLLVQYDPWDPTRAPAGRTTAWAYCHVPSGSPVDMTQRLEAQVERYAPGFRDRILARHTMSPSAMEAHDANYVGGDINIGIQDLRQLLARPLARRDPYRLGAGLYLCSSATPPGGGVHGIGGVRAARSALRHELR